MMIARILFRLVAASAVFLVATGVTDLSSSQKEVKAQAANSVSRPVRDAREQAVSVIPNPPAGWTTPVNISNLPAESSNPSIAVDNSGKVYATWEEWYGGVGAPRSMCFNTNTSGAWGTSDENYLYYVTIDDVGYPVIACDPSSGTAYLAYHDGDFANANMEVMFKEYTQGIKTWEGWVSLTPDPSDYANIAVNPVDRTVYVMWFDDINKTTTWELVYRYRDPVTKQWSGGGIVPVFLGRSKYWRDMVIDKTGTAHLVFALRSPTDLYYTKNSTPKDDSTWTAPVSVSGNTDRDWAMPRIAVDGSGDVYIVWYANTGGYESATEEVMFRKTVAGVWQPIENLSNSPTRSEGSVVAVDPDTKDVYVAWHEYVAQGNWEVYLRMYTAATKSWGDIYNMTNDSSHSAEPFIRIDAQKGIHLVYHDYIGDNREIFYTQKPGIGPPINIAVDSSLNAEETQKTNTITWAANPSNASLSITNYKIYRKNAAESDSGFTYLSQVSGSTFSYVDTVSATDRKAYRIATVTSTGAEGQSATVNDKPGVFAPINVSLTSKVNKILFYEIRDNVIAFAASPNNAASEVDGYAVYRRKVKDSNSAMSLLGTVDPKTLSFKDAGVRGGQKYAYAVKTRFKDGREGNFSAVVAEL